MATFTTRRRRRAIIAAAFLLAGTLTVINGSAQAADGPFFVDGLVPDGFVVPPPKAEEMYMPETFGRGDSDRVIVE